MSPEMLDEFRQILLAERDKIVKSVEEGLKTDLPASADKMPDANDLASARYEQGFAMRLKGRERVLLNKVEQALRRLESGDYGYCDICDDEINPRRLRARPVTTLCIECKEEQEMGESRVRLYASSSNRNFSSRESSSTGTKGKSFADISNSSGDFSESFGAGETEESASA